MVPEALGWGVHVRLLLGVWWDERGDARLCALIVLNARVIAGLDIESGVPLVDVAAAIPLLLS